MSKRIRVLAFLFSGLLLWSRPSGSGEEPVFPAGDWTDADPVELGMDRDTLLRARSYALSGGGSGIITRAGKRVLSWGEPAKRYDLKSTSKSIGVTALGLAILDGKIALEDRVEKHHPSFASPPESNRETGWPERVTIFHLATQTAGFEKPGGYHKLTFEPGEKWLYSDGGPNWLAECVTLAYQKDVEELLFERVFSKLGIERSDLGWRKNAYRPEKIQGIARREFGSGVHANVDAMARLGYLYLRRGRWKGERILPESFIDRCRRTPKEIAGLPVVDSAQHGRASDHYGLLWWNNGDGTLKGVPRDAYWSWGLYDSLILVVPSLDIVAARAGRSWSREGRDGHYAVLEPFFGPIISAAADSREKDSDRGTKRGG